MFKAFTSRTTLKANLIIVLSKLTFPSHYPLKGYCPNDWKEKGVIMSFKFQLGIKQAFEKIELLENG